MDSILVSDLSDNVQFTANSINELVTITIDPQTEVVTFDMTEQVETVSFGIYEAQNGENGKGFTDGYFDNATGQIIFESNDGLGFSTPDLRGDSSALFNKTTDDSDDIIEGVTNLFLTSGERVTISNQHGSNNGDQDLSGLATITSVDTKNGLQDAAIALNTAKNSYPSGDAAKLAGIQAGAQVNTVNPSDLTPFETTSQLNARDTANRSRTNHTGTQDAATTITGLATVATSGNYNDLTSKPDLSGFDNLDTFANLAAFPATGVADRLYLASDTGTLYRWSGAAYVAVTGAAGAIWGSITGTLSAQSDLNAALASKALASDLTTHTSNTSNPHSVTKAQVGLGSVDNTSDAGKPVSTAQATAIGLKQDAISLTTTGTSGVATLVGATLNIPNYATGGAYLPLAGGTMTGGIVLASGTTTLQPLKMVSGANLTTPVAGVFEFDGTNLYFSV